MANKVICYVKTKNGKHKKYVSKDGSNFTGPDKLEYDAPKASNHEILDYENWLGRKQYAFYREGAKTPVPLSSDAKWRKESNDDEDANMLTNCVRKALEESGALNAKTNLALGIQGLILALMLFHQFW